MVLMMKSDEKNGIWLIVNQKCDYEPVNEIKFLTSSLESTLCDYSDAYILATGNITVTGGNNNKKVAFKNFALFEKCRK